MDPLDHAQEVREMQHIAKDARKFLETMAMEKSARKTYVPTRAHTCK